MRRSSYVKPASPSTATPRRQLAGVIGARHQRRGYARDAAGAMAMWLREQGARTLVADIHPDHEASMAIARSLGLRAGHDVLESGEIRWTG